MVHAPMALDSLDLARWQFGITTVYHFFLVPLTIGLAPLVAAMESLWLRTRNPQWLTATKSPWAWPPASSRSSSSA